MVTESGGKAEHKTVSIVGMAGSGKTTLANAVYMRLREENCFQCHAFVTVGQKPELKNTLMHMFSMLDNGHQQLGEDIDDLIVRFRHILEKKRYGMPNLLSLQKFCNSIVPIYIRITQICAF